MMLRANRPILAFFDSIKALRVRQLAMILKAGYDPNLMINARGQNGLQFMIEYFGATDAHYRLQAPVNKSAYLNMAKLLLDSGLDPNALDLLADETVLFDAIRYNDKEMVALLLNYVDVSLRNKSGETALMCAARFGSKQVTRLLLEHLRHLELDGYLMRQRNRFGLTPLEIARSENLDAAKVITKHLITYGHHASALARSVSHAQLVGPRRAAVVAAAHQRATRAGLLADEFDVVSPSDYDSDVAVDALLAGAAPRRSMAAGAGLEATGTQARALPAAAPAAFGYHHQAYFDPKAAEFSQYLLEQQQQRAGRPPRGAISDDDNDQTDEFGARAGPLLRSRSCMLGPSGSSGQRREKAYGAKKAHDHQGAGPSKTAGWQDQSSGGGQ